jgi:pyruvate kinase
MSFASNALDRGEKIDAQTVVICGKSTVAWKMLSSVFAQWKLLATSPWRRVLEKLKCNVLAGG